MGMTSNISFDTDALAALRAARARFQRAGQFRR